MEKSCIYCGIEDNLSKSDIIPDALTNRKILNDCVCQNDHNSKFSDAFESEVIQKLAFITNELDIKSSKSDKFPAYMADFIVEGETYSTKTFGYQDFIGKKIVKNSEGTVMMGPMEKIKQIKGEKDVTEVDLNQAEIMKRVSVSLDVFYSHSMFRLVAKIAFEWYMKENKIITPHPDFADIVKFITEGEGKKIVSIIEDVQLYEMMRKHQTLGSHLLLTYTKGSKETCAIISLFGIAMYEVVLSNYEQNMKNCCFLELRVNATQTAICCGNYAQLPDRLAEVLINGEDSSNSTTVGTINVNFPQGECLEKIQAITFMLNSSLYIQNSDTNMKRTTLPSEQLDELFKVGIHDISQSSILHIRGLKRFVKENVPKEYDQPTFSFKNLDRQCIFYYYLLMKIGKGEITDFSDEGFKNEIQYMFATYNSTVNITEKIQDDLKKMLQEEDNHVTLIKLGSEKVRTVLL